MAARIIAALLIAPVLVGFFTWGRWGGRHGELPGWFVGVLVIASVLSPHPLTAAVGSCWAVGWVLGHRATSRRARLSRLEVRRLRAALQRREMRFHYQPIIDLSSGRPVVVSAESLVRWHHPNGKVQGPGPWLDTIQQDPDLSCLFSDQLWEDAAVVASMFPHLRISLNTMPEKVAEAGWAENVLRLLPDGVTPAQFTIEVVEGTLLRDTECVRHNLETLCRAGFHIALDDFGSGNANMVTLMAFIDLVDTVKVDQLLIRHPDHRGAEAVIDLARSFGKFVVAEGVEEPETAEWLQSIGVDVIQGWLFSRDLTPQDFSAYVLRHGGFEEGVGILTN